MVSCVNAPKGKGFFGVDGLNRESHRPAEKPENRFSADSRRTGKHLLQKKENFAPPFFGTAALCFPENGRGKVYAGKRKGQTSFKTK
ncbi:MAG: hypothetical protein ACLRRT_05690 [Ruthenibacterium lactatiformans]